MSYASVVVEGGLFPADLLDNIATGDISGQRPADFGDAAGRLTDAIQSAFADARAHYDSWQRRRATSALSDTRLTREDWAAKLAELLGYGTLNRQTASLEAGGRNYPIYATAGAAPDAPPVHIVGRNQALDRRDGNRRSPHALVQEYLNNSEALWGMVSNGDKLRLLRDSARFSRPTYLEFDLAGIIEGNQYAEFALLYRLLHRSRLPGDGEPPNQCLLEQYYQQGLDRHGRVRENLRDGVEQALLVLGNGFLRHPGSAALRGRLADTAGGGAAGLTAEGYYRQLLRLVYRLLFLMTAEERGMLSPGPDGGGDGGELYAIYDSHYSVSRLRRRAEGPLGDAGGPSDLWPGLLQTFAIFGEDEKAKLLGLKALDGELFDAGGCRDLESAGCSNYALLRAMLNLSTFWDGGDDGGGRGNRRPRRRGVRRRVNYAGIDVEEFGSVYESLLDFHPRVTPGPRLEFSFAAGSERRQTGSYYTPPELVKHLVDSALEPVMGERLAAASGKEAKAEALLGIKVCDPAAGSGHFLLAAARRIARRVAQIQSGEEEPAPADYRAAMREVIRNCIYAVDKNPLAVDLCKVALWIEGHEPGLPLSFLDHRVKCGDSLVGVASWEALAAGIPNDAYKVIAGDDRAAAAEYRKRNRDELRGKIQLRLGDDAAASGIADASQELAGRPENSVREVQAKAARYDEMRAPGQSDWWARKVACDLWTAAFFIAKGRPERGRPDFVPTTGVLRRHLENNSAHPQLVGNAVQVSADNRFFHWPLEFAEIFGPGGPGGFDVVLGNPPWGQKQMANNPAVSKFIRSDYKSLIGIFDWFRPFLERGVSLLRKGGRYGLVLPDTVLLKDYESTRRFLLENTAIKSIIWWGPAFASATIDATTIAGILGVPPTAHEVDVVVRDPVNLLVHAIPQRDFWSNPRLTFNLHLTPEKRSVVKILNRYPTMGEFFEIHEGVHSGNIRSQLFVSNRIDASCRPLILKGREICPYALDWEGAYIRLDAVPGKKTAQAYANIGKRDWHEREKLVIQRTGDRVIAAVDREKRFSSNNFFIAFPKRTCALELDGLCAVLNSAWMTWFFRTIEPREGRVFAELKIKHLEQFPLPLRENGDPIDSDSLHRLNYLGGERARLVAPTQPSISKEAGIPYSGRVEFLDKEIDLLVQYLFSIVSDAAGETTSLIKTQEVNYDHRKHPTSLFDC